VDIDACLYSRTLNKLAGGVVPDENSELMQVLAASIQQYWVNALAVQGYILGLETDELNRRLPGLLSYVDLSPEEQEQAIMSAKVALTYACKCKEEGK